MENNYFVNILTVLFFVFAVAVFGYVSYEIFSMIDGFFVPFILTCLFGSLLLIILSIPCSIAIASIASTLSYFLERKEKQTL
ncbi:hypothetical protein ACWIUH_06900 [Ursidibacter arcticus]